MSEPMHRKPLPLIQERKDFSDTPLLDFQTGNLKKVLQTAGDRPLFVVTANGPRESGKTLFLAYLCRYLTALETDNSDWLGWENPEQQLTEFTWENSRSPTHLGIWIYDRAFIINLEDGDLQQKEIAVLLLYTQLPDIDKWTNNDNIFAILGLSVYISSHAVLNFPKTVPERGITGICEALHYSLFRQLNGHSAPLLQELSFLIHDWDYPTEYPYGVTGGTDFIRQQKLKDTPTLSKSGWLGRKAIQSAFKETFGCLLPFPGYSTVQGNFRGSVQELESAYLENLQEYFGYIIDLQNLACMIDHQTPDCLYASDFEDRIGKFVSTFNRNEMPERSESRLMEFLNIQNCLLETEISNFIEAGITVYLDTRQRALRRHRTPYYDDNIVQDVHRRASRDSKQKLRSLFGDISNAYESSGNFQLYFEVLNQNLNQELTKWTKQNNATKSSFLADSASELLAQYPKTMSSIEDSGSCTSVETLRRSSGETVAILLQQYTRKLNKSEENLSGEEKEAYLSLKQNLFEAEKKFLANVNRSLYGNGNNLSGIMYPSAGDEHTFRRNICRSTASTRESSPGSASVSTFVDNLNQNFYSAKRDKHLEQQMKTLEETQIENLMTDLVEQHKTHLSSKLGSKLENITSFHKAHVNILGQKLEAEFKEGQDPEKYQQYLNALLEKLETIFEAVRVQKNSMLEQEKAERVYEQKLTEATEPAGQISPQHLKDVGANLRVQILEDLQNSIANFDVAKPAIERALLQVFEKVQTKHLETCVAIAKQRRDLTTKCQQKYKELMHGLYASPNITLEILEQNHPQIKAQVIKDCITNSDSIRYPSECEKQIPEIQKAMDQEFETISRRFSQTSQSTSGENFVAQRAVQFYGDQIKSCLQERPFVDTNTLERIHDHVVSTTLTKFEEDTHFDRNLVEKNLSAEFQNLKKEIDRKAAAEPAIGIDLGTTFSCVSVYENGKVVIIPNAEGEMTTPSYVFVDTENNSEVVGLMAKSRAYERPQATIFDAKRLIGRKFSDPIVQKDVENWPFKVDDNGNDVPVININNKLFHAEAISAKILAKLKHDAESYLGRPVTKAVITVPAYFGGTQREATMDAGKIAGLDVLYILNEPVAAALAYKLEYPVTESFEKPRYILVFDLGGGTFDVAVARACRGEVEVLASNGDDHLGGEDFDTNILHYAMAEFKSQTGIDLAENLQSANVNTKSDASRAVKRLKLECERKKVALSAEGCMMTTLQVDNIMPGVDLKIDLTRAKFEEENASLFKSTVDTVRKTLKEAKKSANQIDDIVLVGGSTRIPKVQQLLKELFPGKQLRKNINPDQAVAKGAGLLAAILNGVVKEDNIDFSNIQDLMSISVGIGCIGDIFSNIIPKGTKIPVEKEQEYFTSEDKQREMSIIIFEGEHPTASRNKKLGEFILSGIPPAPKEKEKIVVKMHVNCQGVLHVTATSRGSGQSNELTVMANKQRMNHEEMAQYIRAAEDTARKAKANNNTSDSKCVVM